jgi:hypothetical protein
MPPLRISQAQPDENAARYRAGAFIIISLRRRRAKTVRGNDGKNRWIPFSEFEAAALHPALRGRNPAQIHPFTHGGFVKSCSRLRFSFAMIRTLR